MPDVRSIASAAACYLRKNPDEVLRSALDATGGRIGIPLAALRYFVSTLKGKKAPKDVEITAAPPALRFAATVDAMGTPVRASAAIRIDEIEVTPYAVRITVRLRDVKLALAGDAESPIATLIQSGALDLSKPGNLVKFLPKRPEAIIEAGGDRIVLDLMKIPKLRDDPRVRKALAVITPVLGIGSIETERDHLYIKLNASPSGIADAVSALKST